MLFMGCVDTKSTEETDSDGGESPQGFENSEYYGAY